MSIAEVFRKGPSQVLTRRSTVGGFNTRGTGRYNKEAESDDVNTLLASVRNLMLSLAYGATLKDTGLSEATLALIERIRQGYMGSPCDCPMMRKLQYLVREELGDKGAQVVARGDCTQIQSVSKNQNFALKGATVQVTTIYARGQGQVGYNCNSVSVSSSASTVAPAVMAGLILEIIRLHQKGEEEKNESNEQRVEIMVREDGSTTSICLISRKYLKNLSEMNRMSETEYLELLDDLLVNRNKIRNGKKASNRATRREEIEKVKKFNRLLDVSVAGAKGGNMSVVEANVKASMELMKTLAEEESDSEDGEPEPFNAEE